MSLRKDNSGLFDVAPKCPQESNHGNPFRYCPCGWMEPEGNTLVEKLIGPADGAGTKRYNNKPEIPRSTLENVLAALVKRFSPDAVLSISVDEIIDAPNVEIRQDFVNDTYELRVRNAKP